MINEYQPIPLPDYERLPPEEMRRRANLFHDTMRRRHTIREFSDRAVPRDLIERCLSTAGTAPSGANHQPWHFTGKDTARRDLQLFRVNGFTGNRAPRR